MLAGRQSIIGCQPKKNYLIAQFWHIWLPAYKLGIDIYSSSNESLVSRAQSHNTK